MFGFVSVRSFQPGGGTRKAFQEQTLKLIMKIKAAKFLMTFSDDETGSQTGSGLHDHHQADHVSDIKRTKDIGLR
jgi:hypothetical protein